ncbi:MAG: photosystem II reaction center protein Psb28 [Thermosynechococcaceae cyanobacterium]
MAEIQFVRGTDESVVPDVRLTRAPDGTSGRAFFRFDSPDVVQKGNPEILGMFMLDEDGELSTRDVNAKFVNGQITAIEATYTMRSAQEWDRFMLFMNRYAESHGLGFNKANP